MLQSGGPGEGNVSSTVSEKSRICAAKCTKSFLKLNLKVKKDMSVWLVEIFKMSAKPQQQTNEWCWISQMYTWISTIKLVEKYKTAN